MNYSYVNCSFSGWILDPGVIDHMLYNINMLLDIKVVYESGLPVNLPNDGFVLELVLEKVVFVLDYKFNLLSVSKLTIKHNCVIKFIVLVLFRIPQIKFWELVTMQ